MKKSGTNDEPASQSRTATLNSFERQPRLSLVGTAVKLSILSLGLAHGASHAATIVVNSNLDDDSANRCTLRQAIDSMNTRVLQAGCAIDAGTFGTDDSITFSNSLADASTIVLNRGQLAVTQGRDITIDGSTVAGGIIVDANQSSRAFEIKSATLSINQMTITGGSLALRGKGAGFFVADNAFLSLNNSTASSNISRFGDGDGIYANASTVSLINSSVSNNGIYGRGGAGGGIFATNSASVSLNNSTVSGNYTNRGGGLYVGDSASVSIVNNSSISGNTAVYGGGGILAGNNSTVSVVSSTLSVNRTLRASGRGRSGGGIDADEASVYIINSSVTGNSSQNYGYGGGVAARSSTLLVVNSTLSENGASDGFGGGIAAFQSRVSLINSTVSNNRALYGGGAISTSDSDLSLINSTVVNNQGPLPFTHGISSNPSRTNFIGNNVVAGNVGGDCSGLVTHGPSNFIGDDTCTGTASGDPLLGQLRLNGGTTLTHAPLVGSPLIGAGDITVCLSEPVNGLDQIGSQRGVGNTCTIGAVENVFEGFVDGDGFYVIPTSNGRHVVIPD